VEGCGEGLDLDAAGAGGAGGGGDEDFVAGWFDGFYFDGVAAGGFAAEGDDEDGFFFEVYFRGGGGGTFLGGVGFPNFDPLGGVGDDDVGRGLYSAEAAFLNGSHCGRFGAIELKEASKGEQNGKERPHQRNYTAECRNLK